MQVVPGGKFDLGDVIITVPALEALVFADVDKAITRHATGDWGDVCKEDRDANDESVKDGTRILSSYRDRNDTKFWIITEADRSLTTVLLPYDY